MKKSKEMTYDEVFGWNDFLQEASDFIKLSNISPYPIAVTTLTDENGKVLDKFVTQATPKGLVVTR